MVDVEGDDGHGRGEGDQADGDAVVEGWNVRKPCRIVCGMFLEGTNLCDFHLMTTFASLSLQYKRLRNKNDVFSGSNCWKGLERFICEMSRCFVIFVKSTSTAVNNCPGLFSVVISAQFQFSTFPENCFQFPCFVFSESVIRYKVRSTKYEVTAHLHTNCTKQNKTLT